MFLRKEEVVEAEVEGVIVCCVVLLQISSSLQQVEQFLRGTLLFVQQQQLCVERSLWDTVQRCVATLQEKELITNTATHSPSLQVTRLGRATYKGKPRPGVGHQNTLRGV